MSGKKKKTWSVAIPTTGVVHFSGIRAATEAEAIAAALDGYAEAEKRGDTVHEWEFHRSVTEGNVFHGSLNDAYAEVER